MVEKALCRNHTIKKSLTRTLKQFLGRRKKMAIKGRNPTVNESKHMDNVSQLGCIVCYKRGFRFVPAEIHHTQGKTKAESHFKVLPLCYEHHRGGKGEEPISRHPWKRRFEKEYGTEEELLNLVEELLNE
jgi:hypothetical protein